LTAVPRNQVIDPTEITGTCIRNFEFLAALSEDEAVLARAPTDVNTLRTNLPG
jgi:hypothetical protein